MKQIKINKEYVIDDVYHTEGILRHLCPDDKNDDIGHAVIADICWGCRKKVDKKTLFVFKLWRWNNV